MEAARPRDSTAFSESVLAARTSNSTEQRHSRAKTRLCRYFLQGACRKGRACTYAHSEEELNVPSHVQARGPRDWDRLGQQRRQYDHQRSQLNSQEHGSDANPSSIPVGRSTFNQGGASEGYHVAGCPQFPIQASGDAQLPPWLSMQNQQSSNMPSPHHSFQQQFMQQSSQQDQPQHYQALDGSQLLQQFPLHPLQGPVYVMVPQHPFGNFVQQQQHQHANIGMPEQVSQNTPMEQAFASDAVLVGLPTQPFGIPGPVLVPMLSAASGHPDSSAQAASSARESEFPLQQQQFYTTAFSSSSPPRPSAPEQTGRTADRSFRARRQRHSYSIGAQQQTGARQSTDLALDPEEMDARLLQLLSLDGSLEVDQARRFLEASSWNMEQAFIPATMRRSRRAANDAGLQEAIRRSMIDEEYSGGFAVPALTPEVIAAQTTTSLYSGTGSECEECAICLMNFEDGSMLRTLKCGHAFHEKCIDSWLSRSGQCALCKQPVVDSESSGSRPTVARGSAAYYRRSWSELDLDDESIDELDDLDD